MTPAAIFTLVLNRSGISAPTAEQTNRVREYFNIIATDLESGVIPGLNTTVRWRALYKIGTITTTATKRDYPLASDVNYVVSAFDVTNNRPLEVRNPQEIDELDPDQDETGKGYFFSVIGINSTTGYWDVDIFPTPDTSSETIKYRYYATRAELASSGSEDGTDLLTTYPKYLQNVVLYGTTALFMEEEDDNRAVREWEKYDRALLSALKLNAQMDVLPRVLIGRRNREDGMVIHATITPD